MFEIIVEDLIYRNSFTLSFETLTTFCCQRFAYAARYNSCFSMGVKTPRFRWSRLWL